MTFVFTSMIAWPSKHHHYFHTQGLNLTARPLLWNNVPKMRCVWHNDSWHMNTNNSYKFPFKIKWATLAYIHTSMLSNDKTQLSSIKANNSPSPAPPVFSSMVQNLSRKINSAGQTHRLGVRHSVPPLTPPSLHPPLVSEQSPIQPPLHADTVALSTTRFTEQHWVTRTGRANGV